MSLLRGSDPTLARYLRRLRAVDTVVAASGLPASARATLDAAPRQVLTPRTAAGTVLRRAGKPTVESQALLAGARGHSPVLNEAIELAEAFIALVRGREAAQVVERPRLRAGPSMIARRYVYIPNGTYHSIIAHHRGLVDRLEGFATFWGIKRS